MTTYNTGNPIGSADARDLYDNAQNLDTAVNGTAATFTDRLGNVRPTLKHLESEYPLTGQYAAAAALSEQNAENSSQAAAVSAGVAAQQATLASAAKTAAELARDATLAAAKTYTTTAAGIAATTSNQVFLVTTADPQVYNVYSNNAGTAALLGQLDIGGGGADFISDQFINSVNAEFTIQDASGNVAFGVMTDGTVAAQAIDAGTGAFDFVDIDGGSAIVTDLTAQIATIGEINGATAAQFDLSIKAGQAVQANEFIPYAFSVQDVKGNTALALSDDGKVGVNSLAVVEGATVNGDLTVSQTVTANKVIYQSLVDANYKPNFDDKYVAELTFFASVGQSNAENGTQNVAGSAPYAHDIVVYPNNSTSPTSYFELQAGNNSIGGGAVDFLKELLLKENGLDFTEHSYQILLGQSATSSTGIGSHIKGGTNYTRLMTQAASGMSAAQSQQRSFAAAATFFTQGEAEGNETFVVNQTYKSQMIQMALDYRDDYRAITGQKNDAIVIHYQVALYPNIALTHLAASQESPLLFLATPVYHLSPADLHPWQRNWIGAYYGLVYKRVVMDKVGWKPVQPISHFKQGSVLNVKFHVPVAPLVFDTNYVNYNGSAVTVAKPNYGFTMIDNLGNNIPIASVAITGPDTIKIAASATIPTGSKLRYGINTGSPNGGNLRDSQGVSLQYDRISKPMHNWCVLFEYVV